jgi:hypothetical protein
MTVGILTARTRHSCPDRRGSAGSTITIAECDLTHRMAPMDTLCGRCPQGKEAAEVMGPPTPAVELTLEQAQKAVAASLQAHDELSALDDQGPDERAGVPTNLVPEPPPSPDVDPLETLDVMKSAVDDLDHDLREVLGATEDEEALDAAKRAVRERDAALDIVRQLHATLDTSNGGGSREQLAKAFNEWMRRFIDEPEKFAREWESVRWFLEDEKEGVEPTYGDECVTYLEKLAAELEGGAG